MADNLDDLFSPEDRADLARIQAEVLGEDPEAVMALDRREWQADPRMSWRLALSSACLDEGVEYHWLPERNETVAQVGTGAPVRIPDEALEALREQGADPAATACLVKAVVLDPRFASWDPPEEED